MAGNVRKTWDKEYYSAKARERLERGDDEDDEETNSTKLKKSTKEEFKHAEEGAAGPMGSERAFLKARETKLSADLESKVGRVEIIKPNSIEFARGGAGYFCEVCQCLLKDSASYLDHCNGKRHNRALGYSNRSERADVSSVKSRIENVKRKIDEAKSKPIISAQDEYKDRMATQVAEEEARKRRKREDAELKRKENEERDLEGMDPDIAAMMGFGGFGSKKK